MGYLVGVLATITATILLYLARYLIVVYAGRYLTEKVLIRFPRARNLSGTWETQFWKDDTSHTETVKVSQLFGKVWGIIQYKKDGQLRKYKMTGSIKEGVLSATYEIVSPTEPLDRGSFTLALSPDGTRLEGCYSWTDDDSQFPRGDKYVWMKPLYRGIDGIQIRRSRIHGKGVSANKQYQAGSDVAYFYGYEVDCDTRHSLTLEGCKIEPTGPLKYLNHSCDPNSCFQGRTLVTKRQVALGEELTINYLSTEDHISHGFDCRCGAEHCKRRIGT